MKFVRIILKVLAGLLIFIGCFLAISLAPVDDTPYREMPYYAQTKQRLAQLPAPLTTGQPLRAGWAKVNMTPSYTTPTGGYGERLGKHWKTIADSIFVRAILLDNGNTKVAVVGLDLVITPPTVTEALKKRLPEVGLRWENVYMGAIHSHNSMGGWAPRLVGQLIAGGYDEKIVNRITESVLTAIRNAQANMAPVQVGFGETDATDLISNRLSSSGPTGPLDGKIRLLELKKTTGESALLCTFAGHPTLFDGDNSAYLSRDYPGSLVDRLEKKSASFAVFLAGAVGSTAPEPRGKTDFQEIRNYAGDLAVRIERTVPTIQPRPDSTLSILTLPLGLREPHPRVFGNWRVRPWLFYALYGDYPSDLKALRIGQTVLLGTPCDFSGELAAELNPVAAQKRLNLMVTSFDGGYIGYITPDRYYNRQAYEVRDMNWFGPYNGDYFKEMMTGLLNKIDPTKPGK
ncbi:neutral/alkaline non-lysosomal ceramidase N-terminal domain-containing protein [Spirosoma sp. RP8]|uniref:Neutral/alkaline non-lysosomal ceramidase N-terminal domain-containing protein n=1 Tax=Spirosoma liriopis TaxID=2937440 RepID=A0ABT0HKL7_9BACT|nr:neutral/alkaline non-lysosomal ceramidase N-terminal domain-containing protein [Spirosoma liriopis]MCK8492520.1 neutral/alkaline non-lysosomal ceramidase N-terminal domain-containing protein [Spirosoma liriopis]